MTAKDDPNAKPEVEKPTIAKKPYQFLNVGLLREYLALEFDVQAPFPLDQERLYDDFGAVWVTPHILFILYVAHGIML